MKTVQKLDCTILSELRNKRLTGMQSCINNNGLTTTLVFENGSTISFGGYIYVGNTNSERIMKNEYSK